MKIKRNHLSIIDNWWAHFFQVSQFKKNDAFLNKNSHKILIIFALQIQKPNEQKQFQKRL